MGSLTIWLQAKLDQVTVVSENAIGPTQPVSGDDGDPLSFNLLFACAKLDRKYMVQFKRGRSDTNFKAERVEARLSPGGTDVSSTVPVDAGRVPTSGVTCVCGQQDGYIRCGRCRLMVCRARTRTVDDKLMFTCCASCGKTTAVSVA